MSMRSLVELQNDCLSAIECLYLEVPKSVADSVKRKVFAYTDALEQRIEDLCKQAEKERP